MLEREASRVQELTAEAEVAANAVRRVAGDGQVDRGQVDADLVCATGLETNAEERVLRQQLLDLEVRDRLLRRLGIERAAHGVAPVAADRGIDRAAPRARAAADQGEVFP